MLVAWFFHTGIFSDYHCRDVEPELTVGGHYAKGINHQSFLHDINISLCGIFVSNIYYKRAYDNLISSLPDNIEYYHSAINEGDDHGVMAGGTTFEWNGYDFSRWGLFCRTGSYHDNYRVGSLN